MPLTLNVGLSKKIGQPDFGSLGASCNVAVELPHNLIADPEAFHRQVQAAYAACRQAVNDELVRHQQGQTPVASNGHAAGGNGHAIRQRSNGRQATASQIRAIQAIADRQHLDLAIELRGRYGVGRPDDLSITEASQFIDAVKTPSNGSGGRR